MSSSEETVAPLFPLNPENGESGSAKRHSTLLDQLCMLLGCPREFLELTIPHNRHRVYRFLKNSDLYTNFKGMRNHDVRFDGFSELPVSKEPACGGYLGINVQQYYFLKHNQLLFYPDLPCVVMLNEKNGAIELYPMELLDCDPK
jgi:hypothetical protein